MPARPPAPAPASRRRTRPRPCCRRGACVRRAEPAQEFESLSPKGTICSFPPFGFFLYPTTKGSLFLGLGLVDSVRIWFLSSWSFSVAFSRDFGWITIFVTLISICLITSHLRSRFLYFSHISVSFSRTLCKFHSTNILLKNIYSTMSTFKLPTFYSDHLK